MNKNRIISLVLILAGLPVFAQSFRDGELYKNATGLSAENIQLHTDGEYPTSIEKAPATKEALDMAILAALRTYYDARAKESKAAADKAIADAKAAGADKDATAKAGFDKAVAALNEGNTLLQSAAQLTDPDKLENEGYKPAILKFDTAASLAEKSKIDLLLAKRKDAQKQISDAKTAYGKLLTAKTLQKEDGEAKKIDAALAAADAAMKNDNFAEVSKQVKAANDTMSALQKNIAARTATAQKDLATAEKRYNDLKTASVIENGSESDKAISKFLADGKAAVQKNDAVAADTNVSSANKAMDEAQALYSKKVEENALATLEKAKNRYKFLDEFVRARSSEEIATWEEVSPSADTEIKHSEAALAKEDYPATQGHGDAALTIMARFLQDNPQLAKEFERYESAMAGTTSSEGAGVRDSADGALAGTDGAGGEGDDGALAGTDGAGGEGDDGTGDTVGADGETADASSGEGTHATDAEGRRLVLPKYYVITLREPVTDCLWRISEFDFIYDTPLEWRTLYDANKEHFRDPENPDLVFPGQVLEIPSLRGEKREGTHTEGAVYVPLGEQEISEAAPAETVEQPAAQPAAEPIVTE